MKKEEEFKAKLAVFIKQLEDQKQKLSISILCYQEAQKYNRLPGGIDIITTYQNCVIVLQQQIDKLSSLLPTSQKPTVCPESKRLVSFLSPN